MDLRLCIRVFWLILMVCALGVGGARAQVETLVAPDVFLRGVQTAQGVRYAATFIKPTDATPLRNLSVEMTLPADSVLVEMLVSRQVQFDVVRKNRRGELTLIWQISRVPADRALDAFAFTLAEPLTAELEFYMVWQSEAGEQMVSHFFEQPPLIGASQSEGRVLPNQQESLLVGETGVQVAVNDPNVSADLTLRVLPATFNPPPELGRVWWCSILELTGLPDGMTARVIVPLRRPVAPFTVLELFRQQPDGTWLPLEGQAVVTADGQFVLYDHPGGIVASGGPEEIQPQVLPADQIVIVVEPPPVPTEAPPPVVEVQPTVAAITDGSSNTVIIGEATFTPPPVEVQPTVAAITDGSSNTVIIGEATFTPPPVEVQPTVAAITDGSSNTVIIGEATFTPPPVEVRPTLAPITDGSSNTVIIGEATFTPPPVEVQPTVAAITDGSSNTVIIGEATFTPPPPVEVQPTVAAITDGSSNTVIIGEVTFTPPPVEVQPTLASITDGSSNTVIIGEVTFTPPPPVEVRPTLAPITDGSSNTVIIGEATFTPPPVVEVQPTVAAITDGSSNTVIIGEATFTPPPVEVRPTLIVTPRPSNTPASATVLPVLSTLPPSVGLNPAFIAARPQPFGAGGLRVEIFTVPQGTVQCQAGRINCLMIQRRPGNRVR